MEPHAPAPHRRPVPRQFLERVSRHLLARLLSDHAPALVHLHAFPLDALAASAQTDRAHVDTLWHLLGAAPPELVPLRDDLLSVADVATRAGHEILVSHDVARVLDPELGAEDCAATARLDHRALFDKARPQTAGQAQTKSFASFEPAAPRPLPDDPACRAAFARRMTEEMVARKRSSYFRVHEWRSGSERHLEIVYGKLASARDLIAKTGEATHDVTAQVTDRSTERAHAVFHDDTLRLDIAGYDWVKELVRRTLGECYLGSAEHFTGDDTITLAPVADLDAALSVEGVPGLTRVELQELWIQLGGENGGWVATGARSNCRKGPSGVFVERILREGIPMEAAFHLYVAGRTRPVKLVIATPRKIEFERRHAHIVRIVRDWVVARGFMRVPEHLRGSAEDAASEHAPASELDAP